LFFPPSAFAFHLFHDDESHFEFGFLFLFDDAIKLAGMAVATEFLNVRTLCIRTLAEGARNNPAATTSILSLMNTVRPLLTCRWANSELGGLWSTYLPPALFDFPAILLVH
jgi:hypothetical protein